MFTHVKGISLYIENKICASSLSDGHFFVHSVYERTLNIELPDGSIVAVQKASSPVSPLTVLADDKSSVFFDRYISVGTDAIITLRDCGHNRQIDRIIIGSHILTIGEDTPRFMTEVPQSLSPCSYLIFAEKTNSLKSEYTAEDDPASVRARQIKAKAKEAFFNGDYEKTASALASLIGLGNGLTPSGDDFLTGIVSGIYATGHLNSPFTHTMFKMLRDNLGRTHAISASFLGAALDGQTSLPLIEFITNPSDDTLHGVAAIGHSSGLDALEGFLYYQSLIHKPND